MMAVPIEMVDLEVPPPEPPRFVVGVDLGQSKDYTAIAIVEEVRTATLDGRNRVDVEQALHLRYLERIALGTRYPAIVGHVLGLLDRPPLSRDVPLVVDKTGVGSAVVDRFTAAGVRPWAVTIAGGDALTREPYHTKVPKRELVGQLVALYHGGRLKVAESLPLVPALVDELLNFRIKVNLKTGHDSYEAWRERTERATQATGGPPRPPQPLAPHRQAG